MADFGRRLIVRRREGCGFGGSTQRFRQESIIEKPDYN